MEHVAVRDFLAHVTSAFRDGVTAVDLAAIGSCGYPIRLPRKGLGRGKQVVVALVVTPDGLPLGCEVLRCRPTTRPTERVARHAREDASLFGGAEWISAVGLRHAIENVLAA